MLVDVLKNMSLGSCHQTDLPEAGSIFIPLCQQPAFELKGSNPSCPRPELRSRTLYSARVEDERKRPMAHARYR